MVKRRPKNFWTEEKILEELISLHAKYGYFLSMPDLDRIGLAGLRGAISRSGGITKYWRKLGKRNYKRRRIQDPDELDDTDYLIGEFLRLQRRIGRTPSPSDFDYTEMPWLYRAINKSGDH